MSRPPADPMATALTPSRTESPRSTRTLARARPVPSAAAPLLLVSGAAAATFSVPRYDVRIVVTYLVLALLLLATLARRPARSPGAGAPDTTPDPTSRATPHAAGPLGTRLAGGAALAAVAIVTWAVPAFTYVPAGPARLLRLGLTGAAAAGAVLVVLGRRHGPEAALALAVAAYAFAAAAAIRLDPAPRIDVWYTLQGAADGLLRGQDLYRQVWIGPPGRMAAFTYLPGTAVVLAPGRWLAGDVRWTLVLLTLITAAVLVALPRTAGAAPGTADGARRAGAVAAALLVLLPGTGTQVEQAWTEPLLLACLAGAVLALRRDHDLAATVLIGLALASKQHVVLILPLLAAWPRFGLRRAVWAAAGAGTAMLPWFLADPAAMWHDTVSLLVNFPPLRFSDTAAIAVLNTWGALPPVWLTGLTVVGVVTAGAVAVRRRNAGAAHTLTWCAAVLLVANLVNKQAFYNQYWLVGGLLLLAWAARAGEPDPIGAREPISGREPISAREPVPEGSATG